MTTSFDYAPPKVWSWDKPNGGRFANVNRPIAGPTHDKELPIGRHPLQLYSQGTPNGVKVAMMLEELLALGHSGAEYDAWLIRIDQGDQFGSGFVALNPNSKIPALVDQSGTMPIRVFESGAILIYLAEKFGALLPIGSRARAECLSWLFWQAGSAPLTKGWLYQAAEFLQVQEYRNVGRWVGAIGERPAVQRGRMVNRVSGELSSQLHERHEASDFETKTQDKLATGK
jgi:GST-like protein